MINIYKVINTLMLSRWVNYESMLQACLVGKLIDDEEVAEFKTPNGIDLRRPGKKF